MDPALLVILAIAAVLLLWFGGTFNGLVRARQHVRESWSGVDVELHRRHELVPNLVATVKGIMKHEREVLERIVQLRNEGERLRTRNNTRELEQVEGDLGGLLASVQARFEAYPELKASSHALALQAELANTEDRIALARRYYNGNVRNLNVRCESFPSSLIARMFGFFPERYFEPTPASRVVPSV